MDLSMALKLTEEFFSVISHLSGTIQFKIIKGMDASVFPDEEHKLGGDKNGLYMISAKQDDRLIYVGISNDIPRRIYSHIGTGFRWGRTGNKASFPNCALAAERPWLSEATQEILRKGEFNITAVLPDPPEASALLEAFLVFWGHRNNCKPEINVEF